MLQKNVNRIAAGAMMGLIAGSLSSLLIPKRKLILSALNNHKNDLIEKAKDISDSVLNEFHHYTEKKEQSKMPNFIQGACIGLILGACSALLLTPKTGKQLRNNLTRKYQDLSEKTQDWVEYINDGVKIMEPKKKATSKKSDVTKTARTKAKSPKPAL